MVIGRGDRLSEELFWRLLLSLMRRIRRARITFAVRVNHDGDLGAVTRAVRQAVAQIDPELALFDLKTMDERVEPSMSSRRTSWTQWWFSTKNRCRLAFLSESARVPLGSQSLCGCCIDSEVRTCNLRREATHSQSESMPQDPLLPVHCSFAYSAFACFKTGISGSASFQSVKKSLYAPRPFAVSPCKT